MSLRNSPLPLHHPCLFGVFLLCLLLNQNSGQSIFLGNLFQLHEWKAEAATELGHKLSCVQDFKSSNLIVFHLDSIKINERAGNFTTASRRLLECFSFHLLLPKASEKLVRLGLGFCLHDETSHLIRYMKLKKHGGENGKESEALALWEGLRRVIRYMMLKKHGGPPDSLRVRTSEHIDTMVMLARKMKLLESPIVGETPFFPRGEFV